MENPLELDIWIHYVKFEIHLEFFEFDTLPYSLRNMLCTFCFLHPKWYFIQYQDILLWSFVL